MNEFPESAVGRVAQIMAGQAMAAHDPQLYIRDLVERADFPVEWRQQVGGAQYGDLGLAARRLLRWARAKGDYRDRQCTAVAALILPLLEDVGPDIGADIVAVLVAHDQVRGGRLRSLVLRFHVPELVPDAELSPPPLTAGIELQGRAPAPPDLLDVGFLAAAVRAAASVCRIETINGAVLGTGVLIADTVALTCRHVTAEASHAAMRLRFRCTTSDVGTVVALDPHRPVVAESPPTALDFTALRLAGPVDPAAGVHATTIAGRPTPTVGEQISILQHPSAGPMKLGISSNGVVHVDAVRHRIRYHTITAKGSSGAPCFDEHWRLVALHQSEHSTLWGSIRQGIPTDAIDRYLTGHER